MNPIEQKIIQYYYTNCAEKIRIAELRSKNYEKTVTVKGTNIYLEILTRMNHIVKIINSLYGENNPNK